ncbi:S9 family peptidase [Luteimonas saliphila]|uniref:S9 family peptidase n=1 Tax=Luteimonas saliphila TaxID=2804919 RepID=UPI001EE17429|nr:S9 family peptidase [Luteimonas saliphila]
MSRRMAMIAAAALLAWVGVAHAAPTAADYERSLGLRERWIGLTRNVVWPAQWLPDHRFHYRKTVEGGFRFVVYDAATGSRADAFDHARLAEALRAVTGIAHDPLRLPFEQIAFDGDGAVTMHPEGAGGRVRCDLEAYACAPEQAQARRPRAFGVVRDLSVPADNTPRRSPDGRWEAFADGDRIVLRRTLDGSLRRLADAGSAEAFDDPESIQWSPDSRYLAFYRVVPGTARRVTRVETAPPGGGQPQVRTQLYPKPGDAVDVERPVLVEVDSGRATLVDDALFGKPYRLSPIRWRADGRAFAFDYVRRGHQHVALIEVAADSGVARAIAREDSRSFVDISRPYRHEFDDGRAVLWISERDGWRHLYLHDVVAGGPPRQLTRGEWVVREVLAVDEARRVVWFAASGMDPGRDPYRRHLFRVGLDGGEPVRLTHVDADHDVAVSPDGRWYVDVYSRVDVPPVMELRRADGTLVAEVERGDIDALLAAGWRPPEPFVAKGRDGATDIWGLVVRPRDHDPGKRYPVIENIYAGPHDSFVPGTFWPFGYHSGGDKAIGMQALADLGFIVVQIDGMGTANRSKAFHDVAWKNLGDSGFPDRIAWHRALAARDPSYDITRVGIYGASAGGQSTLGGLLFHPEFYRVGVAWNGCYDNRMDKISWNEQWMGWPVDDSYARASGVENAHRLQGALLLIVGEQDENVDPASTMQVVAALVRAGKDFDLLAIPGGGHAVGRSTGPIGYVHRRQFDFFVRHLLAAQTPRWNTMVDDHP